MRIVVDHRNATFSSGSIVVSSGAVTANQLHMGASGAIFAVSGTNVVVTQVPAADPHVSGAIFISSGGYFRQSQG